jgi:hypothetical protein
MSILHTIRTVAKGLMFVALYYILTCHAEGMNSTAIGFGIVLFILIAIVLVINYNELKSNN